MQTSARLGTLQRTLRPISAVACGPVKYLLSEHQSRQGGQMGPLVVFEGEK